MFSTYNKKHKKIHGLTACMIIPERVYAKPSMAVRQRQNCRDKKIETDGERVERRRRRKAVKCCRRKRCIVKPENQEAVYICLCGWVCVDQSKIKTNLQNWKDQSKIKTNQRHIGNDGGDD